MPIKQINSQKELVAILKENEKVFLLLYKSSSEVSECALKNLAEASQDEKETLILAADVSKVRDIHPNYKVTSAPSVLIFENGEFKNIVKGCNEADFYVSLLAKAFFVSETTEEDETQKRVTVYSTPSCSWCTTIKNYFSEHNIKYTDIDVSASGAAAKAMVQKSGQQGVPQTEIDGQMIIGFDKSRINQLLGIQ